MIKIRGKFIKDNELKYIGHLDLMRLFQRAFRRADIPVKYSEGFNPQPKLSLATALSLGIPSHGEYFDLELNEEMDINDFTKDLNEVLPEGVKILKAVYTDDKNSVASLIRWGSYVIELELEETLEDGDISKEIKDFLGKDEIIIVKEKKKKGKRVKKEKNIRKDILDLSILTNESSRLILKTTLRTGSDGNLKPEDLITALKDNTKLEILEDGMKIQRLELFIEGDEKMVTPI